jgi:phosphoribosylglycinamide formyltransferase 1
MTGSTRLPAVILISGRGSNMQAIAEQAATQGLPVDVRAVISDRPDAAGLAVAGQLGLVTSALPAKGFADRPAYDAELAALVKSYEPRLVILAGFMRILTSNFIGAFTGSILNIHPSLLPKYRGLHTHRRAIEAGDSVHGASVHFVTEELDGGPVIIQACVPVLASDTEATLSVRVQRQEHTIYPQAIEWFARGRLLLKGEQAWLDGQPLPAPVVLQS